MITNRKYPLKFYTFSEKRDFVLESGEKFGPITVGYETFGTLNLEKDNAILVIHALTGDTHVTSAYDKDEVLPGWWDYLVGPGKSIDTNNFFVICANYFGGCSGTTGPASINPDTGKPYGLSFPIFTVADMVKIQKKLIESLGIIKLKSLIGGSLGGMLILDWVVRYPNTAETAVIIASAYKTSPQIIGFGEVERNAIMADSNFNNGNYYNSEPPNKGLSIARMLAHITYLSKDSMEQKFGREIRDVKIDEDNLYEVFGPMFQVESYLRYQGKKFVERFDANSYLYLTKAMDMFDLKKGSKTLDDIFKVVKAHLLVISFTSDWHFYSSESWEIVKAMMHNRNKISYVNIDALYGHDSFLIENYEMKTIISKFLNSLEL